MRVTRNEARRTLAGRVFYYGIDRGSVHIRWDRISLTAPDGSRHKFDIPHSPTFDQVASIARMIDEAIAGGPA